MQSFIRFQIDFNKKKHTKSNMLYRKKYNNITGKILSRKK